MSARPPEELERLFRLDPSMAYDCDSVELGHLLFVFGEQEVIIDAINVVNGASFEQRARDIGVAPEDFLDHPSNQGDEPVRIRTVDEL